MPTVINLRVLLWVVFAFAFTVNVLTWTHDYPPTPPAPAPAAAAAPLGSTAPAAVGAPSAAPAPAVAPAASAPSDTAAGVVHVRTDVLDMDIGLAGGTLVRADLLAYPKSKSEPAPIRLLNTDSAETRYVLQSGLAAGNGAAPNHLALMHAPMSDYTLAPGQASLDIPLTWSADGVTVTKTFHVTRGHYDIGIDYRIDNGSAAPWRFAPYTQIVRNNPPVKTSYFDPGSGAYKGPAYFDGTRFQKLDLAKHPQLDSDVQDGYLAALQHEFVTAVVPPRDQRFHYSIQTQGTEFALKAQGPTATVAPGQQASVHESLFLGPKLQHAMNAVHPRLDLVADYGWLRVVATPLFKVLEFTHGVFGNWGIAIILATLLLKLLFYPLAEASGRSMAKMKTVAPRLQSLREQFKDNPQQLNRATMELYQREKINPIAGCLPMLIQIPVFLAFYWVLRDSVELRQAHFLWINDLSVRDPIFILPFIMAAGMFVQYKINPQVGDPMQQKVFMLMPMFMSVTFAFFPAGLVLYWVTNTLLSILQQWNINRRLAAAS